MIHSATSEFYPMNIRESRYDGTYSNGQYILIAGTDSLGQIGCIGSDTEATRFWSKVEDEGPLLTVEINGAEKEIYADSGDSVADLQSEFESFCRQMVEDSISKIITKVFNENSSLVDRARDGDNRAAHALFAASIVLSSREHQRNYDSIVFHLCNRRFPDTEISKSSDLSIEDIDWIAEFLDEEYNASIPLHYGMI